MVAFSVTVAFLGQAAGLLKGDSNIILKREGIYSKFHPPSRILFLELVLRNLRSETLISL